RGNTAAVDILSHAGADVFKVGEDRRTPYKIALAASHKETATRLRDLEAAAGSEQDRTSSREGERRLYCKAYRVADLSRFPGWRPLSGEAVLAPDDVVFLHQNYVVARAIWQDKDVLLPNVTPEWQRFCDEELGFKVPDDFDLMTA